MSKQVFVLNGPNLNLLGTREPHIYGSQTLKDVENLCSTLIQDAGFELFFHQSNHEGEIIEIIHTAREKACGLILNAGAFTHTSIAIHDALKALEIPKIEVHISNPHSRESFRQQSFVAPASTAVIAGFGINSYKYAILGLIEILRAA